MDWCILQESRYRGVVKLCSRTSSTGAPRSLLRNRLGILNLGWQGGRCCRRSWRVIAGDDGAKLEECFRVKVDMLLLDYFAARL